MKLKYLPNKYHDFILEMTSFVTLILIFLSGIGRYRFILVYAIYFLLKALSALITIEQGIYLLFLPAFAFSFYFDFADGPILPLYSKNNLIIAFLITMAVNRFIKDLAKKLISRVTEGQYFIVCPACHFKNKDLIEKCTNCSYVKGSQITLPRNLVSPDMQGDKISTSILNLLNLNESEVVLYFNKISSYTSIFKNRERQLFKLFIITSTNIRFLDYKGFFKRIPSNWRRQDIIPLEKIIAVEGTIKKYDFANRPVLILTTASGDIYEVIFSIYEESCQEKIKYIASLIKRENPKVELNIK